MAYEGELLNFCPPNMFDFSNAFAVVVSGSKPNYWGHMLLNTGGPGGIYFQVAGVVATPRYMNEGQYRRYLKESEKTELRRIPVFIKYPEKSQLRLEKILSEWRGWLAVWHNCEEMVEDIVMAGGGPSLHRSVLGLQLPTNAGWSAWDCGARGCPGHSERKHHCASGVWSCRRITPACPGHSQPQHQCDSGDVWTCRRINPACPSHSARAHRCGTGSGTWTCRRKVPACPGHRSSDDNCSEQG
jgi:hypothetical protein